MFTTVRSTAGRLRWHAPHMQVRNLVVDVEVNRMSTSANAATLNKLMIPLLQAGGVGLQVFSRWAVAAVHWGGALGR